MIVVTDDDALARAVSDVVPSTRRSPGALDPRERGSVTIYDLASGDVDALSTLSAGREVIACYPADEPDVANRALASGAVDTVRRDLLRERPSVLERRLGGEVGDGPAGDVRGTDTSVGDRVLRDVFRLGEDPADDSGSEIERLLAEGSDTLGLGVGTLVRTDGERDRVLAQVGTERSIQCPSWSGSDDGAALFVPDTRQSDRLAPSGSDHTPGAFVGCPVTVGGTRYGTLCFHDPEPREPFSEYERTLVELLGRWTGYELERREHSRRVAIRDAAIDAAADGFYRLDEEGRFTMVNDALLSMTGYDREDLLGEYVSVVIDEEDAARGQQLIGRALSEGETESLSLPVTIQPKDGGAYPAESRITVITDEEGGFQGTIGVSRDVSAQRAFEETLTELHQVSRELLAAETETEIATAVVDASDELIDGAVSGVFLFDEAANALVPAATSETTASLVGEAPTFEAGEGIAWDAFVSGERRAFDDVRESDDVYNPETEIRSELVVPLGDHGVVILGSTEFEQFDEGTLELADILAANAEAALDRTDREQRLRDRERELRTQNRRLAQLDEVNDRVRRITHELLGADSREAIERLVCERLAEVSEFEFVWIGSVPSGGRDLKPRAWSGAERGYLDTVDAGGPGDAAEPSARAARRRETVVVPRTADQLRKGEWQREALTRDFTAVVSVPLVDGGVPYGVLSIYMSSADAVTDDTVDVLEELGDSVARAIDVVEQRQARLSEREVELELRVEDATTSLQALSETLSEPLAVERVVPQADGSALLYGTGSMADRERLAGAADEMHGIADSRLLGADDRRCRFELRISGPSLAAPIADHGGSFERLVFDDGRVDVIATFPADAPISDIVESFVDRYPSTELLARRHREREPAATEQRPLRALTDRQREALDVAYHSGFFEWPRESTGEEIAQRLDITAPTFLEHLRRAERDVVGALLDGE